MKFSSKAVSFFIALVIMVVSVGVASSKPNTKVVDKARAMVENASPDDWETLAKSASMCIRKNVNMKEALEWLDKSLTIKETVYNLELKGDYYLKSKLPRKAIEFYVSSMRKGKSIDFDYDTTSLENKIAEANKLYDKIG